MKDLSPRRPHGWWRVAAVFAVFVASGCQKSEQIRTYAAPKEAQLPEKAKAQVAATSEPTDRMITAIVPVGGQAYFFKVVGPIAAIDKHQQELNDFFAAIRIGDDGKPKWTLPESWSEQPGSAMRLATIVIPEAAKPLEISVTALPWAGTAEGMLSNVNRWRNQLQLPPVDASKVGENVHELKAADKTLSIVDLRGHFAGSSMAAPFAGGAGGAPFAGGNSGGAKTGDVPAAAPGGLPAGHPPIDSPSAATPGAAPDNTAATAPHGNGNPAPSAAAGVPKMEAPADWKPQAASGMRKAVFTIGDENNGAIVTVINFPLTEGQAIADPLQNVNQWRRAMGLSEVKADELSKFTESMEVDGKPTTYVRVVPDPSQADQSQAKAATLAAMVNAGDQVWFFKLLGERSTVVAQEEAFKNFLKSVKFPADGGSK